jgi:hypothetical protein
VTVFSEHKDEPSSFPKSMQLLDQVGKCQLLGKGLYYAVNREKCGGSPDSGSYCYSIKGKVVPVL